MNENDFYFYIQGDIVDNISIRQFTKEYKKAYRILIIGFYSSAFLNDKTGYRLFSNLLTELYLAMKEKRYGDYKKVDLDFILNLPLLIETNYYLDLSNDNKILSALSFFKKYKENFIKDGQTLYLYDEVKDFWNINELYPETIILPHHWLEFRAFIYSKPVLTFPEYFAYQDLINTWNLIVEKSNTFKNLDHDFNNDEYRETNYVLSTLKRNCIISGVHFAETYLYYLYYNFKKLGYFKNNKLIKRNDIRKINDKEIIKDLIFKEFPGTEEKLEPLFIKYIEIVDDRDAFTHISAFTEDNRNISRIQRLININSISLADTLDTIFKLVSYIDDEIGKHAILFWRKYVENPDFYKPYTISALMKKR